MQTIGATTSVRTALAALALTPSARLGVRQIHFSSTQQAKPDAEHRASSDAAFRQRQIIDELRAASSNLSEATSKPKHNSTAEAALDASSGARGGGIPLGMAGLAGGGGPSSSGPTTIDKMIGQGKAWKDLKGGQKVARATVQTSRSALLLGGAAITLVLTYALTTELFAKNSPTVVFSDACKRVTNSGAIAKHLLPPYRYHTSSAFTTSADFSPLNPPARGRRSRSVASITFTDERSGQEMMVLRFFVEARQKDHDVTLWDRTRQEVIEGSKWIGRKVVEGGEWLGEQLGLIEDETADSLRNSETQATSSPQEQGTVGSAFSKAWNFSFGSLTGLARGSTDSLGKLTSPAVREPGTWSSGEVHAEMVKDENGTFQYKHMYVDVPNSSAVMRDRVWVIRKLGQVER